ncbi:protein GVQW3-like [Centruroides vittatus]|uniref:protein GVQW3-like n=1 Tax=Centruroides vittatus TaxID=120091 RepID=UPI0035102284
MEKTETRAVIKYLTKKGLTPSQIKADMDEVLGESALSCTTVKKWTSLFKSGRESVEDDPRSGRPSTAVTEENIDKVHDFVLADRRLKTREIAETTGISVDRVHHTLTENLGMTKVSARLLPHLLTPEQNCVRTLMSKECFDFYQKNPQDFLHWFVTTDKLWIHHCFDCSFVSGKEGKDSSISGESDSFGFLGC